MWVCAEKTQALASVEGLLYPVGALNDSRTPVFVGREICIRWEPAPDLSFSLAPDVLVTGYALGVALIVLPFFLGWIAARVQQGIRLIGR